MNTTNPLTNRMEQNCSGGEGRFIKYWITVRPKSLILIKLGNLTYQSFLQKNPDNFGGIQLRQIKNGVGIGRVISKQEYHLIFQDTKYSFSEDTSNQIDFQSYCNPRVFLTLASIFLRHLLVEKNQYESQKVSWLNTTMGELDSAGYQHTLIIENLYADRLSRQRDFVFSKYFPEVTLTQKSECLYSLRIETNRSVFHLINLASLVCMYLAATNSQPWFLNQELCAKYVRIIKNLAPVPYFILYLFSRACIPTLEMFNKLKADLESSFDGQLNLCWGNTQDMRMRAVRDFLLIEGQIPDHVLEMGCGEMDYPRTFIKKLNPDRQWWCVDPDDYSHLAERIKSQKKCDNLFFSQNLNAISGDLQGCCLLMTEVVEHMAELEAYCLIKTILELYTPNRGIITTPNIKFNQYYQFEEDRELRHHDHRFEFNFDQFKQFMERVIKGLPYNLKFFGIGDQVNDEYVSLAVEIQRQN